MTNRTEEFFLFLKFLRGEGGRAEKGSGIFVWAGDFVEIITEFLRHNHQHYRNKYWI